MVTFFLRQATSYANQSRTQTKVCATRRRMVAQASACVLSPHFQEHRMTPIAYRDRALFMDDVPLADIAAKAGTPCYVYSAHAILKNYRAYDEAFGAQSHTVCYAVKANGNLAILSLLAKAGAGFDIVSGGEL